jgi:hypothetical protein
LEKPEISANPAMARYYEIFFSPPIKALVLNILTQFMLSFGIVEQYARLKCCEEDNNT